jgi:hypothetical protein
MRGGGIVIGLSLGLVLSFAVPASGDRSIFVDVRDVRHAPTPEVCKQLRLSFDLREIDDKYWEQSGERVQKQLEQLHYHGFRDPDCIFLTTISENVPSNQVALLYLTEAGPNKLIADIDWGGEIKPIEGYDDQAYTASVILKQVPDFLQDMLGPLERAHPSEQAIQLAGARIDVLVRKTNLLTLNGQSFSRLFRALDKISLKSKQFEDLQDLDDLRDSLPIYKLFALVEARSDWPTLDENVHIDTVVGLLRELSDKLINMNVSNNAADLRNKFLEEVGTTVDQLVSFACGGAFANCKEGASRTSLMETVTAMRLDRTSFYKTSKNWDACGGTATYSGFAESVKQTGLAQHLGVRLASLSLDAADCLLNSAGISRAGDLRSKARTLSDVQRKRLVDFAMFFSSFKSVLKVNSIPGDFSNEAIICGVAHGSC